MKLQINDSLGCLLRHTRLIVPYKNFNAFYLMTKLGAVYF